jgi:TetR/AcrR family transcriptional regulator, regulator of biofilm formation and stress response
MREKNTPNDPHRRERIVEATMGLLRSGGLAAVTARAVAQHVGIPVGSVSYHFTSVRGLLLEASRRILAERTRSLREWSATVTPETLPDRLGELIHEQLTTGRDVTVVAYELFIHGLRDPEVRRISEEIVAALREALAPHLPAERVEGVAAAADGLQMHGLLQQDTPTAAELRDALSSVITGSSS